MLVHLCRATIQWDECDPAGIVFFANYFKMADRAFNAMLEAGGWPLARCREHFGAAGFPLLEAGAKFRSAASFGETVEIESRVVELGRKTVRVAHLFRRAGAELLEADELRIWAVPHPETPGRLKSAELPDELRGLFEAANAAGP